MKSNVEMKHSKYKIEEIVSNIKDFSLVSFYSLSYLLFIHLPPLQRYIRLSAMN